MSFILTLKAHLQARAPVEYQDLGPEPWKGALRFLLFLSRYEQAVCSNVYNCLMHFLIKWLCPLKKKNLYERVRRQTLILEHKLGAKASMIDKVKLWIKNQKHAKELKIKKIGGTGS